MTEARAAVYLAQPAHRFGGNAFLPYSAGRLWAYAAAQPDVVARYRLAELIWARDPVGEVLEHMRRDPPAVLGLSVYVWNEQYCLALARAVKAAWPGCVVVVGGPQVPDGAEEAAAYMGENECVDWLVHGEGEETFAAVLRGADFDGDYSVTRRLPSGRVSAGGQPARIEELGALPSPYLAGVFDALVADRSISWQALQETDRGCPYACAFCQWGAASLNRIRAFPLEVLGAELEWMARHGIEVCYNCDANFGMLPHHEEFAARLIDVNRRVGYPRRFRAAYAKRITERVFRCARALSDAGLSKGATVSFQSLREETLSAVRRINTASGAGGLRAVFERYGAARIPTYSELILGLPGETLASFTDGIDALLNAGQHRGLAVYLCVVLRNSEMARPEYRARHGLITRRVRQLLLHGTPQPGDIPEDYELVVETATLPHAEWRAAWRFAVTVQALHCAGFTDGLARAARARGLSYAEFYGRLVEWAVREPRSAFGMALAAADTALDAALAGGDWPTTLPEAGPVQWPVEELVTLRVAATRGAFYREMLGALGAWGWGLGAEAHRAQWAAAPNPTAWRSFEEFAREEIWYGRKGGAPARPPSAVTEEATP